MNKYVAFYDKSVVDPEYYIYLHNGYYKILPINECPVHNPDSNLYKSIAADVLSSGAIISDQELGEELCRSSAQVMFSGLIKKDYIYPLTKSLTIKLTNKPLIRFNDKISVVALSGRRAIIEYPKQEIPQEFRGIKIGDEEFIVKPNNKILTIISNKFIRWVRNINMN